MVAQLDATRGREIVARWCALAERRLEYLADLYEMGRWRRFYSEHDFLEDFREAKKAVETWRGLLSREASGDNRPIDLSWLGRRRATDVPQVELWCDPVHLAKAAEIARNAAALLSDVLETETLEAREPLAEPARDEATTALAPELTTIAARYPLLYSAL